ncbi:MAG TPA: FUSC family protein, partial [Gammaproteobacteria bacterium]|nr:FUSC family protein [Gammaproteobacteria bacterium]
MAEQTAAVNRQVQLQEAFKLALSMTLFYWLALWMNWDLPKYGALAIIVVSLSTTGASLNKGVMRIAGTGLGALAGFALLSWFAQSPTGILLGVSVYLLVIGYFMQTSRQADTWFNAGFIAVAVWSSSYMKVDTAFHFASIRFLETAAGVSVFTLVSTLLWPRTSGQLLPQQGKSLWTDLQTLFGMYRQHLQGQALTDDTAELRIRLAGAYQKLLSTLEGAYADTPAVKHNKAAWELLRVDLQAFAAAQELWRESIADCKQLPLDRLLPGLDMTLDTVAGRLVRGTALWLAQADPDHVQAGDDAALLTQPDMTVDPAAFAALTLFQQAVLMNFVEQLKSLETNSRDLLQTLRVLAGLDPADRLHVMTQKAEPFRPVRWNPERLLKAVFPALCWITAWVFWVYVQPPGGPVVPMMATVFGLMMVMAPVNLLGLLLVLLLSMFIVVAPVYLLLMPTLDSGFSILALIFVYTFCFGFLGGISPVLKIGPLLMFVNVANITNDQTYSFILLITGGLVMLMGVSIVVVVHRLLSPMHAEQILLRTLRRFFHGCAQITAAYAPVPAARMTAANKRRRRVFENRIQPLPEQLQAA